MAGRPQKAFSDLVTRRPSALAKRRPPTQLAEVPEAELARAVPPPPEGVGDVGLKAWALYWRSQSSRFVDVTGPAFEGIKYWCQCVDMRAELWERYRREPTVPGQRGVLKANPVFPQIRQLDAVIARYEDQYGLTPLAQMRLGVEFLGGSTLEENLEERGRASHPRGPQPKARTK